LKYSKLVFLKLYIIKAIIPIFYKYFKLLRFIMSSQFFYQV